MYMFCGHLYNEAQRRYQRLHQICKLFEGGLLRQAVPKPGQLCETVYLRCKVALEGWKLGVSGSSPGSRVVIARLSTCISLEIIVPQALISLSFVHPRVILSSFIFLLFRHSIPAAQAFLFTMHFTSFLLAAASVIPALGQLSGKVGPLTTHATKTAKKTCNVLNYGAKADKSTDLGPPLLSAFTACKTGGTVVVPAGDFAINTWVTFEGGKAWALQLDGTIYRTGSSGGNMLFVRNANDFEMFSSTGKGAIQGMLNDSTRYLNSILIFR